MADTRKIIRVFLASPGDLQEERKMVREIVNEFNESWADPLGYHVDLIGWEDTLSAYGRPQHLINQDLDRCDLFLGMLWKRWGTPPDTEGKYTSGFHEEFERSVLRRNQSVRPEIALFFKEIPDEFLADPGSDLQKVLNFKQQVISEKRILFQKFSTVRDMESLARKSITAYVNRVRKEDASFDAHEDKPTRAKSDTANESDETRRSDSSPVLAEGFEFLDAVVARIRKDPAMDDLTAADIARLRLLANSISEPGNHEMELGAHDINLLFVARADGMKLGRRETQILVRLGFRHLSTENAPIWCWYASLMDSRYEPAVIWSFAGANADDKVGAINVLSALERELPNDDVLKREWIINSWFSEESAAGVKNAALSYLARNGIPPDIEIARSEYDRNDYSTSRNALECMVRISLRTNANNAAQELVLNYQFDSMDAATLRAALDGFEGLGIQQLQLGLEHRNSAVRLEALRQLIARGCLDDGVAERLTRDSDALIRNEALATLSEHGRSFSEEEVRRILEPSQKQTTGILGGFSWGPDPRGKELFEEYRVRALMRLPEAELEGRVKSGLMYDDNAYFALVEQYFSARAAELRRDVDKAYGPYFEKRIRRTEELVRGLEALGNPSVNGDLVKQHRDLEDFIRKKLTRRGLNVLCRKRKREDVKRIRANLKSGYAGISKFDAEYLERHGEWADITLLATASGPKLGGIGLAVDEEYRDAAARAIYKIGRHSVSKLLSLGMPATILQRVVQLCAESRFSKISNDALVGLLNHESDEVRRAAAVKAVLSFPSKRIKSVLDEYVSGDRPRYYNVIHWLDLGVSMSRDDARKVARAASG